MKNVFFQLCILLLLGLPGQIGCNTTEPPPDNPKAVINLSVEDVSCTEAWINLKTDNIPLPAEINLVTTDPDGNSVSQVSILKTQDSLLYIDSLLPNKIYKIHSAIQSINQTSNMLSVTTLDITSHNFTWQTWAFGEHSSSVLYDVAIINENNIWAVGEIYMKDSLGNPDPKAYNAVRWDGVKWNLRRIQFYTFCGQPHTYSYPARAIFAFNGNEIFVSSYSQLAKIRDTTQINIECLPVSVNKLWGSSSSDLYAVGNNGSIAHYNGNKWTKIESGTNLDIYDIWGDYDNKNNQYIISFVAAEHFIGPARKIFSVENNNVKELSTENIPIGSLHGIWFKTQRKYFVVGNGINVKNNIKDTTYWDASLTSLSPYYIYAIRGSNLNNIFVCGSFGESLHFNGMTWISFRNTPGFNEAEFLNTDIKKDLIVSAGYKGNRGFIAIGRR